jgi:hypothetical protein
MERIAFTASCTSKHSTDTSFLLLGMLFNDAEWLWIIGGMTLTGERLGHRRKSFPSANLFTVSPAWTSLRSNPDLRDERPATNRLSHGTLSVPCRAMAPSLCHTDIHFYTIFEVLAALCLIIGFRREAGANCSLLGCYSGNFLRTFRDNRSVPPSRVKNERKEINETF